MQDVKWDEMIIGTILGSIVILVPSAVIYLVLGSDAFCISVTVIGIVGSILIAKAYPGPDRLLEHGWLLAVVFVVLPVAFASLYLAGVVSSDTATDYVIGIFTQLSFFLFVLLTVLYVHAKGVASSLSAEKHPPTD
jgi:hypothetical protein